MVAFNTGRGEDLRAWTGPAVRTAREAGRPVVVAGAEALAALGELWGGDPDASAAGLERATAILDGLDDDAIGEVCATAPMLVGVAQWLSERYLSEKTVENALTRVYAKLGVRSRSQLTRELTAV
jgi:hypothetical protein